MVVAGRCSTGARVTLIAAGTVFTLCIPVVGWTAPALSKQAGSTVPTLSQRAAPPPVTTNPRARALYLQADAEGNVHATQDAALRKIDAALLLEPGNSTFWYVKGRILSNMEEDEQALTCIKKCLEIQANSVEALAMEAKILAKLKKLPEAMAAANKAVKGQDCWLTRCARSTVYMAMDQLEGAEQDVDCIIERDSSNNAAHLFRSHIAAKLNHWDKVIDDMSILLSSPHMNKVSVHQFLGQRASAYSHIKQYDKAVADYTLAIRGFPDDREMHAGLLGVYKITGNTNGVKAETAKLDDLDGDIKPWK